jgi:nuclear pore complex protein Nup93
LVSTRNGMLFSPFSLFLLIKIVQVDEEDNGGLRGLAEVLLNYGERHFEGAPGSKDVRTSSWVAVLLTCGEFERVSANMICRSCLQ